MTITWDISLVILSALVAILGSFAAFTHLRQMRESSGYSAYMWLFAGASSLGLTIWGANFIGLMAIHLQNLALDYALSLAMFSTIPAILLSLGAFYVLRVPVIDFKRIVISGILIGISISLTQYSCIATLQLDPPFTINPGVLVTTTLAAIIMSILALTMGRTKTSSLLRSTQGAFILGLSITALHLVVTHFIQFSAATTSQPDAFGNARFIAMLIALVILFWFAGSIVAMLFDKRIVRQNAEALVKLQMAYDALDKRAQKLAKDRSRSVLDKAMDAVINIDTQGQVIEWNAEAERIFGYSYDNIINQKVSEYIVPHKYRNAHDNGIENFLKTGENKMLGRRVEITALRKNGEEFPIEISVTPVRQHNELFFSAFIRDITERKSSEQQIHQLAFFDALTQLPNRRLVRDRLLQAFAISKRNGQHGAVLLLDLDHFKTLNDSKGHEIGDLLLIEVAKRLKSTVRDGDTVARLGGDEFLVMLELSKAVNDAIAQAELIAEKVRDALSKPFRLQDCTHHTTPSIGIALFKGSDNESVDDLLKHADTAMYQAKKNGRNAIRFYDPVMQAALEARAALENELRHAIETESFILYYQIQVDSLKRPIGAEVLLRWQRDNQQELSSPLQYITLAEETNLIIPIGEWVLDTACKQLHQWQDDPLTRDLVLAVNVSAKQFRQPDFVSKVQNALFENGAKPSKLKLELTESTVLENVQDTISKMRELKLLGVDFSMDDFGTGYSSLQYLKRLPLNQIKIDQSFVRDITSDPNDAAIVQTIIAMSHALGLNVIAEGVETREQMDFLDKNGCHTFQGYLFSKPIPVDDFEQLLIQHQQLQDNQDQVAQ